MLNGYGFDFAPGGAGAPRRGGNEGARARRAPRRQAEEERPVFITGRTGLSLGVCILLFVLASALTGGGVG